MICVLLSVKAPSVTSHILSEMADASGWGVPSVNSLLKARKKDINLNNLVYSPVFYEGDSDEWVHFVYHDLPEKDKFIFEHRTGFGNKPVLSNNQIAKKLNISASTVSQRIKMISAKIAEGVGN